MRSAPAQLLSLQIQIPGAHAGFIDGDAQALLAHLDVLAGGAAQPAQSDMRFDACDQFARAEWLDEVVICADVKSFDARFLSGACR